MELTRLSTEHFENAYAIMQASFPADECRPYQAQKALFQNPDFRMYGLIDGDIKALVTVYDLGSILFIEHFAVNEPYRNQGLGAQSLRELRHSASKMICLEVELPETPIARRRLAFYQRNGFFLNDYPYLQPPLAPGQNPVPLKLMTSGRPISEAEFGQVRALLYKKIYHQ